MVALSDKYDTLGILRCSEAKDFQRISVNIFDLTCCTEVVVGMTRITRRYPRGPGLSETCVSVCTTGMSFLCWDGLSGVADVAEVYRGVFFWVSQ